MATKKDTISATLALRDSSYRIPQLGFGTYLVDEKDCYDACTAALKAGYRHIDTAQFYANEAEVGRAVKDSGLKRSDVFLSSKILFPGADVDESYASIVESVKKLDQGDNGERPYVDLFLVHSPNRGREARENMWGAIERAKKEGYLRSIGTSNFGKPHIEEMKKYTDDWPPAVNQIEVRLGRVFL